MTTKFTVTRTCDGKGCKVVEEKESNKSTKFTQITVYTAGVQGQIMKADLCLSCLPKFAKIIRGFVK